MTPTQYLSALLVALASFQSSSAIPTSNAYSEVIPGEGMPSLAELGLTSEQLYTMPVEASMSLRIPNICVTTNIIQDAEKILTRAAAKCGPVEAAYTDVNDVVACYNYLKNLGTRDCAVGRNYARSVFVHAGRARVIGQGSTAKATSSYW